jgi:hypothetical protein
MQPSLTGADEGIALLEGAATQMLCWQVWPAVQSALVSQPNLRGAEEELGTTEPDEELELGLEELEETMLETLEEGEAERYVV